MRAQKPRESAMAHAHMMHVLNDPVAQELLHAPILARMAYTGRDRSPRVIPIGFYWNGAQFIVCTVPHAPKVRALATNPKVALTIDTETWPPHVLLVRGTATIEIVDGIPPEYLAASRKSVDAAQWDAFEAGVRALYKQMARIAIEPEWAKVLDFETRLPTAHEQLVKQAHAEPRPR